MSDSQRPKPPTPTFEVPDLELEPVPRSLGQAAPARPTASAKLSAPAGAQQQLLGASFDFGDELEDFEFERSAQPNSRMGEQSAPHSVVAKRVQTAVAELGPSFPTARAPEPAELSIDPLALAILADYGDPPESAPLTIAYAYRVFTRQRELKRQLIPIAVECERAQAEREATLAELARELRPTLEEAPEFRRFVAPLLELSRRAAERGHALNAINAQLGAELGQFDAELAQVTGELQVEERLERDAQIRYDDREANAKRADAKVKRVQIEMRAVTHVAEQKLGPQGGQVPDSEAAQLASLRQRAEALAPELEQARAELEQARHVLAQAHGRRDALRQKEQQIARQKQALAGAYRQELSARTQGFRETESEERSALAELARAVLAARGTVEISEAWLERVRTVADRADKLMVRAEMQRRAIVAYDVPRARQGVRLAGTAVGLMLLLFAFKLIF